MTEETIKCPYCNGDMVLGYIQSPRIIIWSKNKHKVSFLPDETQGDILVKRENLFGAYQQATRCPDCGTVIIRDDHGHEQD